MNTATRGICILLHVTPGISSAISCGGPATHLAFHPSWGRAMECCGTVAHDLNRKDGFSILAWDTVENYPERAPEWATAYVADGGQS